jgi:hypothetical protein
MVLSAWESLGNQTPVITQTQIHCVDSAQVCPSGTCQNVTESDPPDRLRLIPRPCASRSESVWIFATTLLLKSADTGDLPSTDWTTSQT